MFKGLCLYLSFCSLIIGSQERREDIVIRDINHGHHNHWGAENYNERRESIEQLRGSIPVGALIHNASTSIVSGRLDRGVIDLPGVARIASDDSPIGAERTVVNVAATVAVETNSKCCNSNCCDDDHDNVVWCCC